MKYNNIFQNKIGIIGLGYVGLPLAVEFSKKFKVFGYDSNIEKIKNLIKKKNIPEIDKKNLKQLNLIKVSNNAKILKSCDIYIITVPTPIYKNKKPDLRMLLRATKTVGKFLKPKNIVIFESTVYPGTTEEICIPLLEKISKLKLFNKLENYKNQYFWCGYSPERINPSDRTHLLTKTNKLVSGSNKEISEFLKFFYKKIIKASVILTPNIKVAETSKILENAQRDINIALMNEISIICKKLGINTLDVIKAAGTKWNFEKFYPGLVGGHCIGVDPYYMAYKAKKLKVKSELIIRGRKINERMPYYIANLFLKKINKISTEPKKKILIMGVTFKENCPDVRNSKVVDIYKSLRKNKNLTIDLYDPIASEKDFKKLYKTKLKKRIYNNYYDGAIIAVRHLLFKKIGLNKIKKYLKKKYILFDLKSLFPKNRTNFRL